MIIQIICSISTVIVYFHGYKGLKQKLSIGFIIYGIMKMYYLKQKFTLPVQKNILQKYHRSLTKENLSLQPYERIGNCGNYLNKT
jgi:hypothetical protein